MNYSRENKSRTCQFAEIRDGPIVRVESSVFCRQLPTEGGTDQRRKKRKTNYEGGKTKSWQHEQTKSGQELSWDDGGQTEDRDGGPSFAPLVAVRRALGQRETSEPRRGRACWHIASRAALTDNSLLICRLLVTDILSLQPLHPIPDTLPQPPLQSVRALVHVLLRGRWRGMKPSSGYFVVRS